MNTAHLTALAALVCLGGCAASEGTAKPAPASPHATLLLEPARVQAGAVYPETLFGINWNWLEAGGGMVEYGELVRDRSFRNQENVMARAWVESPEKKADGRIRYEKSGGAPGAGPGRTYPGFMRLEQKSAGYTCISQRMVEATRTGHSYTLEVSARSAGGKPALSVFLADDRFMPIEALDNLAWVNGPQWQRLSFTLNPENSANGPYVRVCLVNEGQVEVDEIRLRRNGGSPRIKDVPTQRIAELGVRSLRWPTGSDADHFDWRESIGPLPQRGENPSAFGVYETPSLGLHEFLDYCEARGIVPLVTMNVRLSPASGADLVEYVLGGADTPMGALRAKNGRASPWKVRHFELGNEPTDLYGAGEKGGDTARGYARSAAAIGRAMRAKARQLGTDIELKGVAETTFALADWIRLVSMLSKWNDAVLDAKGPLLPEIDHLKGNFYSAFTWSDDERTLYEEVMGGGTTIANTVRQLQKRSAKPLPFWLTEYGIMVQKNRLIGGAEILLERAKDFQAGLSAADILLTAMQEGFGGAYLFNLSQWGTWGVMANAVDFRLRPSGLAFSMISPLAGQTRLPLTIQGSETIELRSGKGNNPKGTRYPNLVAAATQQGNQWQVVILNRGYDQNKRLRLDTGGRGVRNATLYRLGPEPLTASNDQQADRVRIHQKTLQAKDMETLDIPARSLVRLVINLR
ncbi:MAG: hypothetical protein AB1421_01205 [Pseudomonadota bacterium]